MKTFRCPYCHRDLGHEPVPHCPHCDKSMILAGRWRKHTFRDRQRMRRKIARQAERQGRAVGMSGFRGGRDPVIIGGIIMIMVVVGALIIGRVNREPQVLAPPVSRDARAARELYALRTALERFREDTGRYPTTTEGLEALVHNPGVPGWSGNYVNLIQRDPWRSPYHYELTPEGPVLRSFGADRQPFTDADLQPEFRNGQKF